MGSDGGILSDRGLAALVGLHRFAIRVSGGRLGWRIGSMTVVELHTIGRRTGMRRSVMLTAPISSDERVVLVASKGGADRNPAWYLNLVAHPEIEISTREWRRPFVARTASTEEKRDLWPAVTRTYRGYAHYQERTTRDIPVVVCEPGGGS